MNKVYLAGPMRGIPEFNFPLFFKARDRLVAEGYWVFCPATVDVSRHGEACYKGLNGDLDELVGVVPQFSMRQTIKADLNFIAEEADYIALLPDWEFSKGAQAEKALADFLNLHIIYMDKEGRIAQVERRDPLQ